LVITVSATLLQLYIVDAATTRLVTSVAHGIAWDVTKLYNLKIRAVGRNLQAKVWARTSSEPGWMATGYMRYLNYPCGDNGYWAIRPANGAGGANTGYFSDIRVTPIRKVGGP
jgi:hypothetical protein